VPPFVKKETHPMKTTTEEAVSTYMRATRLGYPWRYGEGRPAKDGRTWLTRFQKTNKPEDAEVIFIGYDMTTGQFVEEQP
jgi:hypothetical protein